MEKALKRKLTVNNTKGRYDGIIFIAFKKMYKIEAPNIDDLNTSDELFKFLKEANPELIPFD